MSKHLLSMTQTCIRPYAKIAATKRSPRRRTRTLAYEPLETREMLSVQPLSNLAVSQNTGEKPQSKVWEYAGQWWTVMPNSTGTWVHRLGGTSWTPTVQITTNKSVHADVKVAGDLAHVLLFQGSTAQLATLQFDSGPDNQFEPWTLRPQLVDVPLTSSTETATLEVDSTGRMWVAYDVKSTVEVRYSDGLYTNWSAPITVASGINSDDISTIIAMPNGSIGVFWSNQNTDRFGFRVHQDGTAPTAWSADELPSSQSALSVGGGMADDHLHVAVASDGTLYAAVKTSYDKSGYPKIALLVRRPNGAWDRLYEVDNSGTRPIIVLNEAANRLIVAYTTNEGGGDIVYRESPLDTIALAPRQILINGSVNNVTSTKQNVTDDVVFLASSSSSAKGVRFTFDTITPNRAPLVNAGPDLITSVGSPLGMHGTVSDDGVPAANALITTWSLVSGPGSVSFGNSALVDTTATFNTAGNYVLRLSASDGQQTAFDEVNISVAAEIVIDPQMPPQLPPPMPSPAPGNDSKPVQIAFQDGLFPSVAYAGTTDTKLNSGSKTKNYGTVTSLMVDGKPDEASLFRWDVSAIPAGSVVVSAAIELNALSTTKGDFEVYALQRAWDELSATWNQYAAGKPWGAAGANGAADHSTAVLGEFAPTTSGMYHIELNEAGVAAVQAWINDAMKNYGIIVKDYAVSDGGQIASSEAATASQRPKLIVEYQSASAIAAAIQSAETNSSPLVNAGPNLITSVGSPLGMDGTVSDDGLPAANGLITTWSLVSGPGSVSFGNSALVDTTATFSIAGNYVLRLSASDGQLTAFDDVNISVAAEIVVDPQMPPQMPPPMPSPAPGNDSNPVQIAFQDGLFPSVSYAGTTDTKLNSGSKTKNYGTVTSLMVDGKPDEASLFRWDVSAIPTGSVVVSAAIELDALSTTKGNFEVYALQRAWDELAATWNQYAAGKPWSAAGANGAGDHATTVLGEFAPTSSGMYHIALNDAGVAAVQAWINDAAKNYGIIVKDYVLSDGVQIGSSEATTASLRPKLIVNYKPENLPPIVDAGPDQTIPRGQPVTLTGTVSDDGKPSNLALVLLWTRVAGPGTVTFGDATSTSTTAQFSTAGNYVLRLSAFDGESEAFDELTVTVVA